MPADIKEEGPFPSLPKFPASSLVASHSRLSPARRVDGEVCGPGPRPQAPLASASFCRQGALRAGWTAEGRDRCFYRCFFRRPEARLAVEAASVVEPAAALEWSRGFSLPQRGPGNGQGGAGRVAAGLSAASGTMWAPAKGSGSSAASSGLWAATVAGATRF